MATCDRCTRHFEGAELACTGCGDVGHQQYPGECDDDDLCLGDVCGHCWAELSHVEGIISCAFGCTCLADFPDLVLDEETT